MKSTVRLIKLAPILLNMYVAIVLTLSLMDEVLKPYLNVKVNYEQAKKITGKTDSAFNSKISRCGLKPTKERLYRYIDMLKIKHKKV